MTNEDKALVERLAADCVILDRLRRAERDGMPSVVVTTTRLREAAARIAALSAEVEALRETENFIAKWVERGLYDQQISAVNALQTIAHFPSMPWKNGRWDVDHKPYAAAFYADFPRAAISPATDGGKA